MFYLGLLPSKLNKILIFPPGAEAQNPVFNYVQDPKLLQVKKIR